ncbi:MAG TPA: hypothetical protein PLB12_11710 [Candidatus Goldiibacteriota bacterium]|nr:hypothetical protein [Candidatus Goldiibacteriota bacterium]
MKRIILTLCIIGIITTGLLFAQGKNGVTQTAQAESTPVVAVSTATADSGTAAIESKTIKTEIQSPGVVTEYKEDGTKVVTINLSEVDENKLPEKYEAKVILEAPILPAYSGEGTLEYNGKLIAKLDNNKRFDLHEKSFSPSGTFLMSSVTDGYPAELDVKIDESGNIYIVDILNSRIQKFNNNGKHVKNIQIKNGYIKRWDEKTGWWIREKDKREIAVSDNRVYLRDSVSNRIEKLDESGEVLEAIDIPDKIDGRSTRDMKMWADEEGVGVGKWEKKEKLKPDKQSVREEANKYPLFLEQRKIIIDSYNVIFTGNEEIYTLICLGNDNQGNGIYYISAENGIRTLKISKNGRLLSFFNEQKCWVKDEINKDCVIQPLIKNPQNSRAIDNMGNFYLLQSACCDEKNCIGKVRVVKVSSFKGNL